MKDIKTKEVTTKPKTKNPASRIPKELMRTAILESKEKSQTIVNARDNDMGEQSPSEYASGKVASAEEWAARKSGRTVTSAGKTAAQASYEKIKRFTLLPEPFMMGCELTDTLKLRRPVVLQKYATEIEAMYEE